MTTDPDTASRAALTVLCRVLHGEVDLLAGRLADMIVDREDVYGALAVVDDLRATCRDNVSRALTMLAGDLPAGVEGAGLVVETGRRRARQGVPLEVVLRAYRLCGRLLWDRLLEVSRDRFDGAHDHALLGAASLVWKLIDHSSARLVDAYRAEEARLHEGSLGRRYVVVEGLLAGRGQDPGFAREATATLGHPPDAVAVCVVAPGGSTPPLLTGFPALWHQRESELVGIVRVDGAGDDGAARVACALDGLLAGPVGVSPPVVGLAGLDVAHRLAGLARRAGSGGTGGAVVLDAHLPEVLLAADRDVTDRLRRVALGGLLDLPDREWRTLRDTLAAVIDADGSPTRAAAALYCHRNTVMYRLARIESLSGRRVHDARDRLLLALGLLATGPGWHPPPGPGSTG